MTLSSSPYSIAIQLCTSMCISTHTCTCVYTTLNIICTCTCTSNACTCIYIYYTIYSRVKVNSGGLCHIGLVQSPDVLDTVQRNTHGNLLIV